MSSQPSWPHPISPSSRLRLVSTSTAQTSWRGCCTLLVGSATSPALFVSLPRAKITVWPSGVIRRLDISTPSSSVYCVTCRALNSGASATRSEEHTSELQSRLHLVCRLLLEKKKNNKRET